MRRYVIGVVAEAGAVMFSQGRLSVHSWIPRNKRGLKFCITRCVTRMGKNVRIPDYV
jgi:hypothetical protein